MNDVLIGILDIQLGNLTSVANAVYESGFDYQLVSTPNDFKKITHLILPGVGFFSTAMAHIEKQNLKTAILNFVLVDKKPTMGICLGFQLLSDYSEEGECEGLGLISGSVKKLISKHLLIPHTGWNSVLSQVEHPVLKGIKTNRDFYFVHSFHFEVKDTKNILSLTEYGNNIVSGIFRENIVGFQFHPEKSQNNGLKLIENFCYWDGNSKC
ncbi:imidazole glycerol phosphate synthase subunit HisH [Pseudoalteromonas denitrificans]|uniref:Imidazole glycerol phosphate synthase subunit HisH n=1 Tax=Pseudoalteromonas denitrificans DSM 6059 TaxID=1123010 RepID=A0A1I1HLC6_9GAMM|nr:imidazole glycerol phosphate synthase subunit HisH [Pseudoalteromonas denitrificans]SFC24555.1 glutamine amidotransferase [Pseudoalteromonas denitrificans DSM 6059]